MYVDEYWLLFGGTPVHNGQHHRNVRIWLRDIIYKGLTEEVTSALFPF